MYQLNAGNEEFTARTRGAFDVLSHLEANFRTKSLTSATEAIHLADVVEEEEAIPASVNTEFKVPVAPPVRVSQKHVSVPDHVINPDKWRKYTLEDVSEAQMSAGANYAAAMQVVHRTDPPTEPETAMDTPIIFNRPIKGRVTKVAKSSMKKLSGVDFTIDEESEQTEEAQSEQEVMKETVPSFKKKLNRTNTRRRDNDDETNEEDIQMVET